MSYSLEHTYFAFAYGSSTPDVRCGSKPAVRRVRAITLAFVASLPGSAPRKANWSGTWVALPVILTLAVFAMRTLSRARHGLTAVGNFELFCTDARTRLLRLASRGPSPFHPEDAAVVSSIRAKSLPASVP